MAVGKWYWGIESFGLSGIVLVTPALVLLEPKKSSKKKKCIG